MKALAVCRGCRRRLLVNSLGLCKRCNKHPSDFISREEIQRLKAEHEAQLAAESEMKKEKAEKIGASEEGEETTEGEKE